MIIALFSRGISLEWRERFCLIISELLNRNVRLFVYEPFYRSYVMPLLAEGQINGESLYPFSNSEDLPEETNFFLCLGGDGTFLESLTMIRERPIPVMGINFGRMGFLTMPDRNSDIGWIDRLMNGDFAIEERSLLKISSDSCIDELYPYALNEISFQRQDPAMLSIEVKLDDIKLPPYWSDGLLISTPTGSTAYSMSLGGPIVLPNSGAMIIVPMAPHNLNVRPLVVPYSMTVEVKVISRKKRALLSLDNRSISVKSGSIFVVTKADFALKYISLSSSSFIEALKEKLHWGEDIRNIQ